MCEAARIFRERARRSPGGVAGPLAVIAAGLAGGFAYWAIAGWSAGFWKLVFRRSKQTALQPASPPPQIR